MATHDHITLLSQGVLYWNSWREQNPAIRPKLRGLNLRRSDLRKMNLSIADLAYADLSSANLKEANDYRESSTQYAEYAGTLPRMYNEISKGENDFWQQVVSGQKERG